jgi:hypothetical protein
LRFSPSECASPAASPPVRRAKKGRTVVQSFEFYDYLIRRRIVKLRLVFDALIDIRVND